MTAGRLAARDECAVSSDTSSVTIHTFGCGWVGERNRPLFERGGPDPPMNLRSEARSFKRLLVSGFFGFCGAWFLVCSLLVKLHFVDSVKDHCLHTGCLR